VIDAFVFNTDNFASQVSINAGTRSVSLSDWGEPEGRLFNQYSYGHYRGARD